MRSQPPVQLEFVTDEYTEKLDRFADDHDVPREAAEQAFRGYCEELQSSFKDGTPGNAVRRIAFHKLERKPPAKNPAEESELSVNVETDRAL